MKQKIEFGKHFSTIYIYIEEFRLERETEKWKEMKMV